MSRPPLQIGESLTEEERCRFVNRLWVRNRVNRLRYLRSRGLKLVRHDVQEVSDA